jgi:hypothetical protein
VSRKGTWERERFVKSVAWDGNCHVYLLSVTDCSAYSIISGAANEMWRLRRSTAAVYRRKRRFWYIQLVHVSWQGKLLVGVSDHESVQEAYWTWFANESFLFYGTWDKAASGGLKISSLFTHIAPKQSELVLLVGYFPSLRGTDIYRHVVVSFPCILYILSFLVMVTWITEWLWRGRLSI